MRADLLWLNDPARSGAQNMQRDRAMFAAAESGEIEAPFLRVYGWSPPAVSLGYHQQEEWIDRARLAALGFDLVRRPTGGAAVLHDEEITYSVAAPLDLVGVRAPVREIYGLIADALLEALGSLAIPASRGGDGRPLGISCFSSLGGHEIAVDGRKLVGSALRRGRRAFLQHGSILVGPGHLRILDVGCERADLAEGRESAVGLRARTTNLRSLGREDVDGRRLGKALARALGSRFQVAVREVDALPPCVRRRLVRVDPVGSRSGSKRGF